MRFISRSFARVLALSCVLMLIASCGGNDEEPTATLTTIPPSTDTATVSATAASSRDIDFTDFSVIGPIIDHFGGGEIDIRRIEFVDMTGDGEDDAFVPVESGGTAGDVGAVLMGIEDGEPAVLGYVETGGRVELRFPEVGGGVVVTTDGVWSAGDAECCPSKLRETTWGWTDGAFVIRDERVIDNPDVE